MKLTPLDIRHKEFKRGMRGYVDGEVDEFLDEIADEFERLFKENIELSERLETMQEKIDQYRNLEETLQNTLVAAQRSAEELRANAQKEAQLMLSEAELKARQMVNDSYADKQAVEKQIVVLRSSEEDFRFKFRSLLDGYTNQLAEVEAAAKKTGRFATPTDDIKQAMAHDAAQRPASATATSTPVPVQPLATRPFAAPQTPPAARPATPSQEPSPGPASGAPKAAPPAAPAPPAEAPKTAPLAPQTTQAPSIPVPAPSAERPGAPAADKPESDPRAPFLGEPDDLLADVESEVDDNAFKW
jgi:cell division initiation protein